MIDYQIRKNDSTPGISKNVENSEIFIFPARFIVSESDFSPYAVKCAFWDINSTMNANNKKYVLSDLLKNISKTRSFAKLPANWNDNGAKKFTKTLIDITVEILKDLDYQPEIFPTGRESILLEYGKPGNKFLGVEVFENKIETFIAPERQTASFKLHQIDELRKIVNSFNG